MANRIKPKHPAVVVPPERGALDRSARPGAGGPVADAAAPELAAATGVASVARGHSSAKSEFVGSAGAPAEKPAPPAKRAVLPQLQVRQVEAPVVAVEMQYSAWAKNYDVDTTSYGWSAPEVLLGRLSDVAPPKSTQRVLDIGVGTGMASVPYLDARAQVTGVDVSYDMLEEARDRHPDFHQLGHYDIDQKLETGGLTPGSFDVVLSSGVLHFSKDLEATLDELNRALAPGGTLAFTFIPPQGRAFGANTKLNDLDDVKSHIEQLGLKLVHDEVFVAYHDKGKLDDPVRYALVVATKPGATPALPASLDRTASVDRARIAKLMDTPLVDGPATTQWVPANDPRIARESKALVDNVHAQLRSGGDLDVAALPFPTVTAESARQGAHGVDALVVLAHPDDESVYTGGTIAALTRDGNRVSLAVATDGGGGRTEKGAQGALQNVRGAELEDALQKLGVTSSSFLGFKDIGKYQDQHRAVPLTAGDTLRAWGFEALVEKIVKQIRTERPKTLLTFDPTRDPNFSLHGHHQAVGSAAAVAVALAADPNAFPGQGLKPWAVLEHDVVVPEGSRGGRQTVVLIDPQAKRSALRAHASQSFSLERAIKEPGTTETWHRLQSRAPTNLLEGVTVPTANKTIALASGEPELATRLRAGDPAVAALYHARSIEQVHKETTKRPIARVEITQLIEKQMGALGALTSAQKKNLERLKDERTGTVVTGQQTGVLGGPLYSIFKALGAVHHAAALSERGVPAVPVFWLASYDSDLKEVQEMKAVGSGDPKPLSLGKKIDDKPVGNEKLGAGVTKMLDELDAVLEQTQAAHRDVAMKLARTCFTPDTTFAAGFSKLIFELTKQHGLLILDPGAREFAALATPVLERELFAPTSSKAAIEVANAELDALGLKPQVHGATDRLNVFFVDDAGKRVFLSRDADGGFTTGGTPAKLSADAAKKLLADSPERFTPSALLRPIVEDSVLPTLTYVGGPSEVSYFAQIGGIYDWAGVPMPQVETRPSFAFVKQKELAALEGATGLGIDALLVHEAPLAIIGRASLPADVRAAYAQLDAVRAEASAAAADAEKLGVARDFPTLTAMQQSLTKKVGNALDGVLVAVRTAGLERCEKGVSFSREKLDKMLAGIGADIERAKKEPGFTPPSAGFGRVAGELKSLDDQAVKVGRQARPELVASFHKLKPGNEPQERTMTIIQLVAELGLDAADTFMPLAQVGKPGRTLVAVDG